MAKRFTDTDKFSDKWYRKLPLLQKVMYEYLLAECNHAGILEKFDIELMSFKIGAEISMSDFNLLGERVIFLSDSVIYLTKFINFQYGELNPQNKVHQSVLRELDKWNIQAPCKPLACPLIGAKNKDKDKIKDNNILLSNDKEKENLQKKKKDPYIETRAEIQKICKSVNGINVLLTQEDCINAAFRDSENPDFWETLPELYKKVCKIEFKGYKPSVSWLLKEKNYYDMRNGVYDEIAKSPPDSEDIGAIFDKLESEKKNESERLYYKTD